MTKRSITGALCAALFIALHGPALAAEQVRVGGMGSGLGIMKELAAAYAARYSAQRPEVLPSLGSAGGIAAVTDGAIAIGISGRALTSEERAKGIRDVKWASSPFVFVTSRRASVSLTSSDIVQVYNGAQSTWPDGSRLRIILRPPSDSTYVTLVKHFPDVDSRFEALRKRKEIPVAPSDQDNIALAERVPDSFTVTTLTQLVTERPSLQLVALNRVVPSVDALANGAYTFASDFFLIIRNEPTQEAKAFFDFITGNEARATIKTGGMMLNPPSAQ